MGYHSKDYITSYGKRDLASVTSRINKSQMGSLGLTKGEIILRGPESLGSPQKRKAAAAGSCLLAWMNINKPVESGLWRGHVARTQGQP